MEADTGGVKGERGVSGQPQPFGWLMTNAGDFNRLETEWNIIIRTRHMHSLWLFMIFQIQNNCIIHCSRREIINNTEPFRVWNPLATTTDESCQKIGVIFRRLMATQSREWNQTGRRFIQKTDQCKSSAHSLRRPRVTMCPQRQYKYTDAKPISEPFTWDSWATKTEGHLIEHLHLRGSLPLIRLVRGQGYMHVIHKEM